MYYLGIDIGGTKIAAGVVDKNYNIVGSAKLRTNMPRPADSIIETVVQAAHLAVKDAGLTMNDIEKIGAGCPGLVNKSTGIVEFSPNLDFHLVNLAQALSQKFGKETLIENDANCAALGEVIAGAAKNANTAIVLTIGTGIGGGIIIDRKIYSGNNYAGAEIGHMVIHEGGIPCGCGRRGCFEKYASVTSLVEQTKQAMKKNKYSLMWELCDGYLCRVNGHTPFEAMRQGDITAKAVIKKYIRYVACGVVNIINIFQPEVLCIGGGICNEGDELMKPLCAYIEKERYSRYSKKQTIIRTTALLNDAGIIGSAFLHMFDSSVK